MACQAKCRASCCCCFYCSYVTSMSQARVPRLFWQEGRLSEKVLPLPQSALLLNFGRNAAESCNQLAAFLQSPPRSLSSLSLSRSLSQPALRQPFVGAPFGPLAVARFCHFWPFTQASLGPELPFMHSFIRSLTHSLIASFIHSILITLWPVSCHKLQQH